MDPSYFSRGWLIRAAGSETARPSSQARRRETARILGRRRPDLAEPKNPGYLNSQREQIVRLWRRNSSREVYIGAIGAEFGMIHKLTGQTLKFLREFPSLDVFVPIFLKAGRSLGGGGFCV